MRQTLPAGQDQLPTDHRRLLAAWLLTVAALVAVMVILGGLTRLTGSGLSMVQWNPHHLLPPLNTKEWQQAFDLYRQTPEYRLVNTEMDLAGYRGIFLLEYVHRLWGRLIGLAFAGPLAFFLWRRMVPPGWTGRLLGLLVLGAMQGVLGWLMVASGLVDRPEVSHFRLAAHLILALLILAALLYGALALLDRPKRHHPLLLKAVALSTVLALTTMTWGALVAGLDAGRIYNSFPLMGDSLLPPEARPPLRNAVENPAAVQYVHRVLALTTWGCLSLLGWWAWLTKGPQPLLLAGLWVSLQAGLGVATVMLAVPIPLAALHQGGAVVLVALLTWSLSCLRR